MKTNKNKISAENNLIKSIKLAMSNYYSHRIRENVARALESKRKKGEWFSFPPFGYKYIIGDDKKKTLAVEQKASETVKKIFSLYSSGSFSVQQIHQKIALEHPEISQSKINNILKNTFYTGLNTSRKDGAYQYKYPAIITRSIFNQCQKIRQGLSTTDDLQCKAK
jgi:DNA invertase Pin-like site-specific DNA recombinase